MIEDRSRNESCTRTKYTYDPAGNLINMKYPSGRSVTYSIGAAGRPTTVTDSNGTSYASVLNYWPNGALYKWLNQYTSPKVFESFTYNSRLQPFLYYSDNGVTSAYYLKKTYNYNSPNNNGNIISITNNNNSDRTQSFTYDSLNRIQSASSSANSGSNSWGETYTIDAWGNMTMLPMAGKASGGTFQLAGDTHNRASTLTYDPAGNLTNNGGTSYTYDAGNMLKTVGQYSYLYDSSGQRFEKWANGAGIKGYWYGSGSEPLAEGDGFDGLTSEYIYLHGKRVARVDMNLNLLQWSEAMGQSPWAQVSGTAIPNDPATTDPNNGHAATRITSSGSYGYDYQYVPTESVASGKQYTFSVWLKAATPTSAALAIACCSIGYDIEFSSTFTIGTTWQRYTLTHSGTYTHSGDIGAAVYVIGANQYVWMWGAQLVSGSSAGTYYATTTAPATATHYYLSDHLNSTSMVVNAATGAVEEESDYRPYGGEQVISGSGVNRYKFTGKERDSETNLDYFGARYYGSNMGRWTSPDWSDGAEAVPYAELRSPQSLNLYSYVQNNPVINTDDDGHECHTRSDGVIVCNVIAPRPLTPLVSANTVPIPWYWRVAGDGTEWTIAVSSRAALTTGLVIGYLIDPPYQYAKDTIDTNAKEKYKVPKPKVSGKEGAKDIPSWAEGARPKVGESGKEFAKRLCDDKFGEGNYDKGPGSDFNKIKKWGDRSFEDPPQDKEGTTAK